MSYEINVNKQRFDVEPRPRGKELKIVIEILRTYQVRLYRKRKADAEHHQP